MTRGDSPTFEIRCVRVNPEDGKETRVPLSGATIRFTAKRKISDLDGAAVVTCVSPTQITIKDQGVAENVGEATVKIPTSQTDSLEDGEIVLFYDVQVLEADGTKTTVDKGRLTVESDVTRA